MTCLLLLALLLMLRTRNNTDGKKLEIFFGAALYYGDIYNYIISAIKSICGILYRSCTTFKSTFHQAMNCNGCNPDCKGEVTSRITNAISSMIAS